MIFSSPSYSEFSFSEGSGAPFSEPIFSNRDLICFNLAMNQNVRLDQEIADDISFDLDITNENSHDLLVGTSVLYEVQR